jgi:ribosomal protein L7/L12
MTSEPQPPLSDTVITAIKDGKIIEAIKQIRVERHLGLKQAKDLAEDYIKTQPELAEMYAQRRAQARSQNRGFVVLLVVVIIALVAFGLMKH